MLLSLSECSNKVPSSTSCESKARVCTEAEEDDVGGDMSTRDSIPDDVMYKSTAVGVDLLLRSAAVDTAPGCSLMFVSGSLIYNAADDVSVLVDFCCGLGVQLDVVGLQIRVDKFGKHGLVKSLVQVHVYRFPCLEGGGGRGEDC